MCCNICNDRYRTLGSRGNFINTGYYPSKVELKDYNVIIDSENLFDQPVKSNIRTYENIRKITTGHGDDYITGYVFGYLYFKENEMLITIDLKLVSAIFLKLKIHQV